jgi:uncharacterized membrane protein YuzA (DUF378 family)
MKKTAKVLLIIGGLNWGLIGLGMLLGQADSWNVINMIFGSLPILEGLIYLLVGIAAVIKIFGCKCKKCAVNAGGDVEKKMQ